MGGNASDLAHDLAGINLGSLGLVPANLGGVSQQAMQSIASSALAFPPISSSSTSGVTSAVERSGSRNSTCSPAMSDSGISVDAISNGQGVPISALQRLGHVSTNSAGKSTCHIVKAMLVANINYRLHVDKKKS